MPNIVIRVENLSKKYSIRHQQPRQPYLALRDVIADKAKSFLPGRNGATPKNSTVEDFWALKDVSFQVKEGEVVGVIGRNGAGKSTLLKILSRITEPTTGRIGIKGRVASLLEVGTGFHPELTGRENIYLNGAVLGMTREEIKRKFDEIVAFAEVEKFLDTPVKRYSSGMYVRLAFAVAAHLDPEILIVDEVLAVGDAEFQKKCLNKMRQIGSGGRTVLFVSHAMGVVQKLCGCGIFLSQGGVKLISSINEVIGEYLSSDASLEYSASYLGDKATITSAAAEWLEDGHIYLKIRFESPQTLTPPILGIVIYDTLGSPVFGTNARFDNQKNLPQSMRSGEISARISTAQLRPSTYYISLWLGDHYQDHCHVDRALRVEVGNELANPLIPPQHVIGAVVLSTEWDYTSY